MVRVRERTAMRHYRGMPVGCQFVSGTWPCLSRTATSGLWGRDQSSAAAGGWATVFLIRISSGYTGIVGPASSVDLEPGLASRSSVIDHVCHANYVMLGSQLTPRPEC